MARGSTALGLSIRKRVCATTVLFVLGGALIAQKPATLPAQAAGSLSGHVFFADTNAPARMATVLLQPVAMPTAAKPGSLPEAVHLSSVQSTLDGSYAMPRVAPGTYYVLASAPGYMSALAALGLSLTDLRPDPFPPVTSDTSPAASGKEAKPDPEKQKLLARLPQVTIQANLPATLELTLERGAAVSGSVLFDDASPAAGLQISLLVKKDGKWGPLQTSAAPFTPPQVTDDRGGYRIAGLAPGEYLVEVDLAIREMLYVIQAQGRSASDGPQFSLPIYSGSTFRTKTAAPFAVKAGEERAGEDIQIPLAKLHGVSGTVLAARDGHLVNGGNVSLLYADDQTEVAKTRLTRDQAGFSFSFVPEGDYILRASNNGDFEYDEVANPPGSMLATRVEEHPTHWYAQADQPVHVDGNLSGLTIAVPEKPAKTQSSR